MIVEENDFAGLGVAVPPLPFVGRLVGVNRGDRSVGGMVWVLVREGGREKRRVKWRERNLLLQGVYSEMGAIE